jgi:hypothetical protein
MSNFEYQKKAGTLFIDNVSHDNLEESLTAVIKNQQTIYQPELVESHAIFQHILTISPELCWLAYKIDNICCGHLIAHPWLDSCYPPILHNEGSILGLSSLDSYAQTTPNNTNDDNGGMCIFLHDLTIIPEMKNMGVGKELVSRFLAQLSSQRRPIIVGLVSVCGSRKFWEKQGFMALKTPLDERQAEILKSYGDKTATIMQLIIN